MENTICPQCGGPVEQSGRGRPRRFCSKQCGIDFYNDAKPRKYRDMDGYNATRHMLSNIDTEAGTGESKDQFRLTGCPQSAISSTSR